MRGLKASAGPEDMEQERLFLMVIVMIMMIIIINEQKPQTELPYQLLVRSRVGEDSSPHPRP